MSERRTPEDVIKDNKAKRRKFALLLQTPEGSELLRELEVEYDGDDITGKSVEETYVKIGQRMVYRMLKNLRNEAQE